MQIFLKLILNINELIVKVIPSLPSLHISEAFVKDRDVLIGMDRKLDQHLDDLYTDMSLTEATIVGK